MYSQIKLDQLTAGSIYKITFLGLAFSLMPLCLVFGVFAVFGFNTIIWNGQPVHGLNGLLLSPIIAAIIASLLGGFVGTACVAGLWLHSKFRPLTLSGKNISHDQKNVS